MNDILPLEISGWQRAEAIVREITRVYGYEEIRTPLLEHTELFARGIGEDTDIVDKEMYTFSDQSGRSLTLRPEGTAPVVRAFIQNHMYADPLPAKLYYLASMYRYGRPQAGRLREFHQFGVEVLGSEDPAVDAEVIALAMEFFQRLGLKNLDLHVNSIGCQKCRSEYRKHLVAFLDPLKDELCATCVKRLGRNPLRILDCKDEACRSLVTSGPRLSDYLCPECAEHFQMVKELLSLAQIDYQWDPYLVRGLDYYTRTTFEIMVEDIGAQSSIGGGGRYDGLVEACGGPPLSGIGFGLGLERAFLALANQGGGGEATTAKGVAVFIAIPETGDAYGSVRSRAFQLAVSLRKAGLPTEMNLMTRSLKAQMRYANRIGAKLVVLMGSSELERQRVAVRFMENSSQQEIELEELVSFLQSTLKA